MPKATLSIALLILKLLHRIYIHGHVTIPNLRCAMCNVQNTNREMWCAMCRLQHDCPQHNISSMIWSLHLIAHIRFAWSHIGNFLLQPQMRSIPTNASTCNTHHPIRHCVNLKQSRVTAMILKRLMTNLQHIQIILIFHIF